jgi:hypothetical protein
LSESLSYSLDGSIKTLKRWNELLADTLRDDLVYSYASNLSVQLNSVKDKPIIVKAITISIKPRQILAMMPMVI